MKQIRFQSLLLFCTFMISLSMATFAYETYLETKIIQSVIYTSVGFILLSIVLLALLFKRKSLHNGRKRLKI
ncbi:MULTISPECIES: hypothetical protein [Bacillus]|uniref:hypothetical protein n=1 Tax=Bacillus TaxID=1386 RepID=UPI0002DFDF8E|nr:MULTISPECIES: hypothetical protein [Bacillus]